ncbi:MAG: DUF1320 domain-containing protein [Desulfuromusa sp.]|nr:DUF1320 domain-containing protein [Desulfuromusa sp.]
MYCTQNDIIKRRIPEDDLIQLTDDNDLGGVDADVVAGIIAEQDELIDGYLRSRYELPLAEPVPGLLTGLAVDLCVHALYSRRAHIEIPESIDKAYGNALKRLREIQQAVMKLDVAGVSTSSSGASFTANERVSGRNKMTGIL